MKSLFLAVAFFTASVSFAQLSTVQGAKYRQYKVQLTALDGGVKKIYLQVNAQPEFYTYGDADIPGHGFEESSITGQVIETGATCNFSSVYSQTKFDSTRKFNTSVVTCAGLTLEFNSSESLLENKNTSAVVKATSTSKTIGSAKVIFEGLKEVLKSLPTDRR